MRILLIALAVATIATSFLATGCPDESRECNADAECGSGLICTTDFRCAQCDDNGDCGAESFCCRGVCHGAADVNTLCGCGPAFSGNEGSNCESVDANSLCLVGDVGAGVDNVSQGTCGCGCTPAEGGPICGDPAAPGEPPICTCEDNDDCRGPSVDANGRPHLATDTCSPDSSCVCFSADDQNACDANSATPDCTSDGCQSLDDDVNNCGVAGRICSDPATGLEDGTGTCVDGGCQCDAQSDCVGGNTDTCFLFDDGLRCVCDGYEANGQRAACPIEATCGDGGCTIDGTPYATQDALNAALGIAG
jgi:hypothetical protein